MVTGLDTITNLWDRVEVPVILWIAVQTTHEPRCQYQWVCRMITSSFNDYHIDTRVFRETVCEGEAGGASANDYIVEAFIRR